MGLNDFNIEFDEPLKVFFSGKVINGRVMIDLSQEKKFRKIKLELVGRGLRSGSAFAPFFTFVHLNSPTRVNSAVVRTSCSGAGVSVTALAFCCLLS